MSTWHHQPNRKKYPKRVHSRDITETQSGPPSRFSLSIYDDLKEIRRIRKKRRDNTTKI